MVTKLGAILFVLVMCECQLSVSSCGFGYEILSARMEVLEDQSMQQQLEIQKLSDQIIRRFDGLEKRLEYMFSKQNEIYEQRLAKTEETIASRSERLEKTIQEDVVPKVTQLWEKFLELESEAKERYETAKAKISKQNDQILTMLNNMNETMSQNSTDNTIGDTPAVFRSCSKAPTKKSGQYLLQPFIGEEPFEVYCEQEKFGGGWLVVQHRFDGSLDFYRKWDEYKTGFGNVTSEFWLGLERIHRLTKSQKYTLVVEVKTFEEKYGYAMYDEFEIGSELEKFSLKQLGSYSGTAGDSLAHHRGMSFSTHDRDNDQWFKNCATECKGAWWYIYCGYSNLNAPYGNEESWKSNHWFNFKSKYEGLKTSRMMIKEA